MKNKNLLLISATLAVLFINSIQIKATVWRVNNNPEYINGCNHCFSNLQSAHDSVSMGDTLHVEASAIPYNDILIEKRLIIIGPGYFLNQNAGLQQNSNSATIESITFGPNSDSSIMKGMRIAQSPIGNSDITIHTTSNILLENNYIDRLISLSNASRITIRKSFIGGINMPTPSINVSMLNISNCYVLNGLSLLTSVSQGLGEVTQCVFETGNINFSSGVNFYNNIIKNSILLQNVVNSNSNVHHNIFCNAIPAWLTGGNNILLAASDVFVTTGTQDGILHIKSSCAQCFQGLGNIELGIYGGNDPYVESGLPNIPSIYQLQSPMNILQGDTINVNMGTRSNN